MKLPVTRRELRHFGLRVRRDWRRLAFVLCASALSIPALALVLPDKGNANALQAAAFFIGFMIVFSVNLCVACAQRTRRFDQHQNQTKKGTPQ